jgi:LacI family transcriptional regulator
MKADINTIARVCGVSKATVSRVFTGKASVRSSVKEKILKKARELNYAPQQVAAREVIAIVVNSLDSSKYGNGFFNVLLVNLVSQITRLGFLVNITEIRDIDKLLSSYTKAAVILLNDAEISKYTEKISKIDIPLVAVGNVLENCHSICFDYYAEIVTATSHLIENGHSRICLILDNSHINAGKERKRGYIETMEKHGFPPMRVYSYTPASQSLIELVGLMLQDKPTAVIICGESIVNEIVYALNLMRISVPNDLSLISFEKAGSSKWFFPPHTTIDQDCTKMVIQTLELIQEVINTHSNKLIHRVFPHKLNIRNSIKNISTEQI